ncbi:hypothetical protein ACH4JS_09560 [Streptomyces sp. NPDC017638]|uniref:hypothetical protein n=1 Tax=Streptomyces sp. NPDC017638 TaxID=3365004 RepID=UPI0037A55BCC
MDDTPYSFLISAHNPLPLPGPAPAHLPPDAEMVATVSRRPGNAPLARVYAGRTTGRPFWLHSAPDDRPLCSVTFAGPDTHDVHAADGTPLARVVRRPGRLLPWPRRVRWTARPAGPSRQDEVTGKAGTWYAWLLYVVTAPAWLLWVLCATVYSFFDGSPDDFTFGSPARTRWRAPGTGTVLDYRGLSRTYRHAPRHLDTRVAYALAVLRAGDRARIRA